MAARRKPMSHIAAELGYASASAFTAMVTRTVGMPPRLFFAQAWHPRTSKPTESLNDSAP
jgi:AraC-like DNA-binding protein